MQHKIEKELKDDFRKLGGVHYIYPEHEIKSLTPVPEGYTSFYISHLGRHGSRNLIDNQDFIYIIETLKLASSDSVITDVAKRFLHDLNLIWSIIEGHDQDLTNKGKFQQRNIARRMYQNHQHLFEQSIDICARSTIVPRCMLSMMYFCDELKTLNPQLKITYDASEKYQKYLNFHTEEAIAFRDSHVWLNLYKNINKASFEGTSFIKKFIICDDWVKHNLIASKFMNKVYNVVSIIQNLDVEFDFYHLFTFEELLEIWKSKNHWQYVFNANASINNNLMFENAKPLLRNIIDSAEDTINQNKNGAHFRFAHDGNIIPLAMLMHLQGAFAQEKDHKLYYQAWQDYKIAPMAGNLQLIFYKKESTRDDILVKILMHENEIEITPLEAYRIGNQPLYPWKVVKDFYEKLL